MKHQTTELNWISVEDALPQIPDDSILSHVRVLGCWGDEWAELIYVKRSVRNKTVFRFEWHGKISPWDITHWAIPTPASKNNQ